MFFLNVRGCFFECVCGHSSCALLTDAKGRHLITWNWSYKWPWEVMWALRTKPRSSARGSLLTPSYLFILASLTPLVWNEEFACRKNIPWLAFAGQAPFPLIDIILEEFALSLVLWDSVSPWSPDYTETDNPFVSAFVILKQQEHTTMPVKGTYTLTDFSSIPFQCPQ